MDKVFLSSSKIKALLHKEPLGKNRHLILRDGQWHQFFCLQAKYKHSFIRGLWTKTVTWKCTQFNQVFVIPKYTTLVQKTLYKFRCSAVLAFLWYTHSVNLCNISCNLSKGLWWAKFCRTRQIFNSYLEWILIFHNQVIG